MKKWKFLHLKGPFICRTATRSTDQQQPFQKSVHTIIIQCAILTKGCRFNREKNPLNLLSKLNEKGIMTIKIGLVQINNSFSGQNYFPYSIGLLQAYAQKNLKHLKRFEFLLPIYSRIKIEEAVEQLKGADIILFITYVWNV